MWGNNKRDPFTSQNFSLKNDPSTRMGFVRKVYGILSAQLLLTTVMIFFASYHDLRKHNKVFNHYLPKES